MNTCLLKILCCPNCKGDLKLDAIEKENEEIIQGFLICSCGEKYSIRQGVPVMMSKVTNDLKKINMTFSQEWQHHKTGDKLWKRTKEQRKKMFLSNFGITSNEIKKNSWLLDAGCGIGENAILLHGHFSKVVAMDVSDGVFYGYKNNEKKEHIFFVQGDVAKPPFKKNTFDYVYCTGVIHHTPNPRESFRQLAKLTKNGGRFYVWVYIKSKYVGRKIIYLYNLLQAIVGRLPFTLQRLVIYKIANPLGQFISKIGFRKGETSDERMVLLWDAFTVRYSWKFMPSDIKGWFKEEEFEKMKISDTSEDVGFGTYGIKKVTKKII